ncbi:cytochrome c oxidase subunit I [Massilia glaciei]|uniref:cytochrome-c oxidase n=1 Tax=Massilia glaciei TaxID=1524097 RepID=A0A2U2HNK8_9BURK|nr:cytochrome c oxidase subunit I [Massilia glaciei]PWF49087.1 cytochrome c oxidase subunit I [Massilia glaciei]
MATPSAPDAAAPELQRRLDEVWRNLPGWRGMLAVNHSTIGLRFIVTGFIFFLIGGVLAMLIRSQLAVPGNDLLAHNAYARASTMHGTTMMFFFAVPVMEGFAVYLIPKMIGARDLIYPRLSAYGYWCYLFGGILLFSSYLFDAVPDGGWFMYVPLNGPAFAPGPAVDFWLLGVTFAEISAVAAGVELVVAILKTRAPGMALHRMPLYAWYILITSFMIVFGFPPLILASILLELERAFGLPFYDTALGGDPLLWQHLFWIFGHPEVYIIFLPAAGIVTTIVPTFARHPMVGYTWVVLAVIATGFISFGLWVHHMFAVGIPLLSLAFFSAASMAVAIPTGIQVFAWIATLWSGRPVLRTPLLYVLGFLFIFVLGGLTGVMVAMVPFDWQVHDTHFVVAHLHYVLFGGMVFPMFAACYYWLPLFSGKLVSEHLSRLTFWMIFIGFNLTFLPMHVTGLIGMPRRVYTYAPGLGWDWLNLLSSVGGFLGAVGVAMFLVDVVLHLVYGKKAGPNPWNAGTLEWALSAPGATYNFASQPAVEGRDPLWDQPDTGERAARSGYYLGHATATVRETLITSTMHAQPQYVAVLPGNTSTPFWAAALTSPLFIGMLAKMYWLALGGALLAVGALFVWAWQGGSRCPAGSVDAGGGLTLPYHFASPRSPGWWGALIALLADATVFASLIFAYFFLWTVAPAWPPPPGYGPLALVPPSIGGAALLLSGVAMRWADAANRAGQPRRLQYGCAAAIALALVFIAAQLIGLHLGAVPAKLHAYGALVHTISGYQLVHAAAAVLMACFVVLRARAGYIDCGRPVEPQVTALFWSYMVMQWVVGYVVIYIFPFVAGK